MAVVRNNLRSAKRFGGDGSSSRKASASEEVSQKIQKKAYEFYLQRGSGHGNDWEDWFKAEQLVRSR